MKSSITWITSILLLISTSLCLAANYTGVRLHRAPVWHPLEADTILVTLANKEAGEYAVVEYNYESGSREVIMRTSGGKVLKVPIGYGYSPDGKYVLAANLWQIFVIDTETKHEYVIDDARSLGLTMSDHGLFWYDIKDVTCEGNSRTGEIYYLAESDYGHPEKRKKIDVVGCLPSTNYFFLCVNDNEEVMVSLCNTDEMIFQLCLFRREGNSIECETSNLYPSVITRMPDIIDNRMLVYIRTENDETFERVLWIYEWVIGGKPKRICKIPDSIATKEIACLGFNASGDKSWIAVYAKNDSLELIEYDWTKESVSPIGCFKGFSENSKAFLEWHSGRERCFLYSGDSIFILDENGSLISNVNVSDDLCD